MKHYTCSFAPNPFKVRLAFAELGIPAEHVEMNVGQRENRKAPFLEINPNGRLPVIDDAGFLLWESNAILAYLGRKHRDKELWPSGDREEIDALRWLFYELATFQPPAGDLWWQRWLMPRFGGPTKPEVVEDAKKDLERPLGVLDAHLARREWMMGPRFTLIDCAYAAPLMCLELGQHPIDAYSNVALYWQRWKTRTSFVTTPFRFPDGR